MDISANIKAIRHSKAIPQAEIARRLDLDPSSYHRLENRGSKLSFEQAEKIAQALGVTLMDLITWDESEQIPTQAGDQNKQLLTRIEELEDRLKDKEKIIQSIENETNSIKWLIDEHIWHLVEEKAIQKGIGTVLLEYSDKEPVRVSTLVYIRKDTSTNFSEDFEDYQLELTSEEEESLLAELLKNDAFADWIIEFYANDLIIDERIALVLLRHRNSPMLRGIQNTRLKRGYKF